MSYKNVFFGDLKNRSFVSREGDFLNGGEEMVYLPTRFTMHDLLERQPLNIGFHIQVYNDLLTKIIFYITKSPTHHGEDILKNIDNSVANVQIFIDKEDSDITIRWIGVDPSMRGKGLAKYLITLSLLYTTIFSPDIGIAKLDDDSDNYANGITGDKERVKAQSKNLYCKMGFEYVDKEDFFGPEMEGNVGELYRKNIVDYVTKRERSTSQSGSRKKKRRSNTRSSRSTRSRIPTRSSRSTMNRWN